MTKRTRMILKRESMGLSREQVAKLCNPRDKRTFELVYNGHTYYAISPPDVEKFPQNFAFVDLFIEPYYEPAIDRGCYGVVIYDKPLTPAQIAGSGLVSEPRE